jgi:hypothetical protein
MCTDWINRCNSWKGKHGRRVKRSHRWHAFIGGDVDSSDQLYAIGKWHIYDHVCINRFMSKPYMHLRSMVIAIILIEALSVTLITKRVVAALDCMC